MISACSHLGLRELDFELLHLLPELSDDASVGVFVHHGVVDDPLGPVRVAQRGQSLLIVISRWAYRGYHGSLAVATQIVLETQKQSTCIIITIVYLTLYLNILQFMVFYSILYYIILFGYVCLLRCILYTNFMTS